MGEVSQIYIYCVSQSTLTSSMHLRDPQSLRLDKLFSGWRTLPLRVGEEVELVGSELFCLPRIIVDSWADRIRVQRHVQMCVRGSKSVEMRKNRAKL